VLKAVVHTALRDPVAALAGWPLWTLAMLGLAVIVASVAILARLPEKKAVTAVVPVSGASCPR